MQSSIITVVLIIGLVTVPVLLFLLIINGVKKGEISLAGKGVSIPMKRTERPVGFWFTIVLYSLIVLGLSWFLIGAIVG